MTSAIWDLERQECYGPVGLNFSTLNMYKRSLGGQVTLSSTYKKQNQKILNLVWQRLISSLS